MAETAAAKAQREAKARQEAEANTAADTPDALELAPKPGERRNVLTAGMPQPPGVQARRSRRSRRQERRGPFVKYVGNASHRVIRAADWGQLGFPPKDEKAGHQEFLWGPKNDYMIESSKFTDEQLDYLLIDDMQPGGGHAFLEVDYDEDDDGNRVLVQVVDEDESDE
jgi:hypothetical protein